MDYGHDMGHPWGVDRLSIIIYISKQDDDQVNSGQ
jgi:hypothetical protein